MWSKKGLHFDAEEVAQLHLIDVVADVLVVVERGVGDFGVFGGFGGIGLFMLVEVFR